MTSYEQTDIRDFALYHSALTPFPSSAPFPLLLNSKYYDIIVCDASFISLQDILPSMLTFANGNTDIFLLWKPQFEVGREHLRKTGVPKSEKVILEKQKIWENFLQDTTCKILHKEKATLPGEAGNQEWIYHICKSENNK